MLYVSSRVSGVVQVSRPQLQLSNPPLLPHSVIAWIEEMLQRDVNDNKKIGNYGAQHILSGVPRDSVSVLTHCNTGSLATAGYGTALGEGSSTCFVCVCVC